MLKTRLCSSVVEQEIHKLRVVGSNPTTVTKELLRGLLHRSGYRVPVKMHIDVCISLRDDLSE